MSTSQALFRLDFFLLFDALLSQETTLLTLYIAVSVYPWLYGGRPHSGDYAPTAVSGPVYKSVFFPDLRAAHIYLGHPKYNKTDCSHKS